ncbi:hypothetical protein TREES_T100010509 [Tupaia chinensis]|uniref:Uncharacterized protein n=1 Tax=Tupaia chinensis TaxID=246437 RepID=L9LAI9_TUPCH|nr:hypothetical protein TREES_T100010509 [Tupaia chinensis]
MPRYMRTLDEFRVREPMTGLPGQRLRLSLFRMADKAPMDFASAATVPQVPSDSERVREGTARASEDHPSREQQAEDVNMVGRLTPLPSSGGKGPTSPGREDLAGGTADLQLWDHSGHVLHQLFHSSKDPKNPSVLCLIVGP